MRQSSLFQTLISCIFLTTSAVSVAATDIDPQAIKPITNPEKLLENAESGDSLAQYRLALAYNGHLGIPRDDEKAVYWYQKAIAQDSIKAKYNLALMYEYGQGVQPDFEKAAALYNKAAKLGHIGAQYSIGLMYMDGKGVQRDTVKALSWLALADNNGYKGANYAYDRLAKRVSQIDKQKAEKAFLTLKNTLPEAQPATLMIIALAGK